MPSVRLWNHLRHRCRWVRPTGRRYKWQPRLGNRTYRWIYNRSGTARLHRPADSCRNSNTANREKMRWDSRCQSQPGCCFHRRDTAEYTALCRLTWIAALQQAVPRLRSTPYSRRHNSSYASGCHQRHIGSCRSYRQRLRWQAAAGCHRWIRPAAPLKETIQHYKE